MEIGITIEEKRARLNDKSVYIVCDNSDYTVQFSFDSEWDSFAEKTACFEFFLDGKFVHEEISFSGDTVSIPRLSGVYEVRIGVYAADNGSIISSSGVRIPCILSVLNLDAEEAEPRYDCFDMMMQALCDRENNNTEAFNREMNEIKRIFGGY